MFNTFHWVEWFDPHTECTSLGIVDPTQGGCIAASCRLVYWPLSDDPQGHLCFRPFNWS